MDKTELKTNKHWLRDLIKACWNVINFSRKFVLNFIFIVVVILVFGAVMSSSAPPEPIANNSVLKLNLNGEIVEEKTFVDPYQEFLSGAMGDNDEPPEVLLTDILYALKQAESDERITAVILNLHGLFNSGLSKLVEVGNAIESFKQNSGKPVIVYGDYFSQAQYYVAAHADTVVLHPMGAIGIDGFGRYGMYYKSALEKLKINAHIFRVGTYKSAVEPYMRDDMSEQAKQANQQWLGELWQEYKSGVVAQRAELNGNFDEKIDDFLQKFKAVDGDFAQFALNNHWVDELMTPQDFDQYLKSEVLKGKPKYVSLNRYVGDLEFAAPEFIEQDKVGIVVARGTIYNGKRAPGEIGGKSTAALLKKAREDDSIKAVVLRVDSPGGSAFASEEIRNEIQAIQRAGKPVIASMSSLAASGGYWISASADEIWAAPSTITGSIGIFGMFMTFEDTLSHLGIHTDGVGTTQMAGMSVTRELKPGMKDVIQTAIENGYDQFIGLVADERNMSKQAVDEIAQGRVWSGKTAKELGLVDNLGSFAEAIEAAAAKAELVDYELQVIKKTLSPFEQFINDSFKTYLPKPSYSSQQSQGLFAILNNIAKDLDAWTQFNDPFGMYVYCLECKSL
ncbi:MAG: signal peptide peptidase SppA [Gammaproteobacteria bacterium]|nr:signal peptide peptidase SppA [Gammaproteobacteria bacterium]